jgi:threonine/homoserine/homoserine lactone efflux protein
MPSFSALAGYGFLLGWSVAWPPGPINAEIARRCLARGFWAGYGVCLGASTGDALWAVLVAVGIGVLLNGEGMHLVLGIASTALLFALAFLFLHGAWRRLRDKNGLGASRRFDSTRASFLLGMTLALTGPWNIAFWLAVMGRPGIAQAGLGASLVIAGAVILGAASWGLIWAGATTLLGLRATGRGWDVAVRGLTGLLMLYYAIESTLRLLRA